MATRKSPRLRVLNSGKSGVWRSGRMDAMPGVCMYLTGHIKAGSVSLCASEWGWGVEGAEILDGDQ